MTINGNRSITAKSPGNGVNRAWDFAFRADEATQLELLHYLADGSVVVHQAADFTVAGLGNAVGGTITYPIAPLPAVPGTEGIVIRRKTSRIQGVRIGNQGRFYPKTHEDLFDRVVEMLQEIADQGTPAMMRVAPGDDAAMDLTLPPAASRAGKALEFDGTGKPKASRSYTDIAADAAAAVVASLTAAVAASATAASDAAAAAATSQGIASSAATTATTAATSAAGSAGTASSQAVNATNAANTASGHATAAGTSATNAAASAVAALASQNAAAASATAAAGSATSASGSATTAGNAATSATASKNAAATSETNAAASAVAAAASASDAAASASAANTSKNNAAASATAAAGSATAAAGSASAAAGSASDAAASLASTLTAVGALNTAAANLTGGGTGQFLMKNSAANFDYSWGSPGGGSIGDMLKATYDPTNKAGDAFSMGNMVETATKKILSDTERSKLSGIPADATNNLGTVTSITLNAPSAGISVNGTTTATITASGTFQLGLLNDLQALEAMNTTGLAVRTATSAWIARTLVAPAAGISITNPAGIAGDITFGLSNDLAAVEGLAGTGIARRTGADAWSVGTTVAIAEGGTGQTTAANAFNALKQDATTSATGVVELATQAEYGLPTSVNLVVSMAAILAAIGETTLTISAGLIAWDQGPTNNYVVTMTGNATLSNPTNVTPGKSGRITFIQDATGGRTLAIAGNLKTQSGAGITLSTAANAIDVLYWDARTSTFIMLSPTKDWK